MMNFAAFKTSIAGAKPPAGLGHALDALWWDAKGDWDKAHVAAQKVEDDPAGQWVHGYLHRKEGDLDNAGYWYRQTGKPVADVPLPVEWEAIAKALLKVRRG
jgi:hypothetical protein